MKQEPRISLYCDECGEIEEFEMTPLARGGWDDRYLEDVAIGWEWCSNGRHMCPDCIPCEECGEKTVDCDCCCVCEVHPCICEESDDDDA